MTHEFIGGIEVLLTTSKDLRDIYGDIVDKEDITDKDLIWIFTTIIQVGDNRTNIFTETCEYALVIDRGIIFQYNRIERSISTLILAGYSELSLQNLRDFYFKQIEVSPNNITYTESLGGYYSLTRDEEAYLCKTFLENMTTLYLNPFDMSSSKLLTFKKSELDVYDDLTLKDIQHKLFNEQHKAVYIQSSKAIYYTAFVKSMQSDCVIKAVPFVEDYCGDVYCMTIYYLVTEADGVEHCDIIDAKELGTLIHTGCLLRCTANNKAYSRYLTSIHLHINNQPTDPYSDSNLIDVTDFIFSLNDSTITCLYNSSNMTYANFKLGYLFPGTTDFIIHSEVIDNSNIDIKTWDSYSPTENVYKEVASFILDNLGRMLEVVFTNKSYIKCNQILSQYSSHLLVVDESDIDRFLPKLQKDSIFMIYDRTNKTFYYKSRFSGTNYIIANVIQYKDTLLCSSITKLYVVLQSGSELALKELSWYANIREVNTKIITYAFIHDILERFS